MADLTEMVSELTKQKETGQQKSIDLESTTTKLRITICNYETIVGQLHTQLHMNRQDHSVKQKILET